MKAEAGEGGQQVKIDAGDDEKLIFKFVWPIYLQSVKMPSLSANPEDVFTFWTTQRISEAVHVDNILENAADFTIPETLLSPASATSLAGRIDHDGGPPSRRVLYHPESEEVSPAYRSIGKLVIDDGTSLGRAATAFYVGNSTVLTVAHAFHDEKFSATNECKVAFIPGIRGEEEIYGKFLVQEYKIHPNYSPTSRCAEYDICKAVIGIGSKSSIDSTQLIPFTVMKDGELQDNCNLVCLGYPVIQQPAVDQVDSPYTEVYRSYADRLMGVKGVFLDCTNKSGLSVDKAQVWKGMSGGPWVIEKSNKVLGVQAGNCVGDPSLEISPKFTTDLFRQLDLHI